MILTKESHSKKDVLSENISTKLKKSLSLIKLNLKQSSKYYLCS